MDNPDIAVEALKELRAIAGEREPRDEDFIDLIRRRALRRGITLSAEQLAEVTPFMAGLNRIALETEANVPGGMANPAFADELSKRVKAFLLTRTDSPGSASA